MSKNIRLMLAAIFGTFLEFYDFVIYIILTPIIAPLFFPSEDPHVSLMVGYAAYAMSFVMRPLGAGVFGAIGDRYGRRVAVMWSMGLMGLATLGMALLPTYQAIGFWAPFLLIVCRLIQGLSAGGEYSGAALMVIEASGKERVFRLSALVPMATLIAVIVGSQFAKIWATDTASGEGWRIPFFIGALVAVFGYFLRQSMTEEVSKEPAVAHISYKELLKQHGGNIALMTVISGCGVMVYYTFATYLVTYLSMEAGWSKKDGYDLSISITLIAFCFMFLVGWLADRWQNGWKLIKGASLTLTLMAVPFFLVLKLGPAWAVYGAAPLAAFLFAVFALTNALTAQLFPKEVRYRAMALSYTVGATLLGGTANMVYTYLLQKTELFYSPGIYLGFIALLTCGLSRLAEKRASQNL